MSDDICYISHREIELQKEYGYKVDRKLYKDLNPIKQELNSMKINVTEQTTTFHVRSVSLKIGLWRDGYELGNRSRYMLY